LSHTGTIITDPLVDSAELFNADGTPVTGVSVIISSAGMGGTRKQLVWTGVTDGTYYLNLLVAGSAVHFGIKTLFSGTTWDERTEVDDIITEGGEGPWGESTITQIDATSPPETMLDTMNLIGPKSVKTKDLEITAHGLNGVEALHKSLRPAIPMSLNAITSVIAKPKGGCDC